MTIITYYVITEFLVIWKKIPENNPGRNKIETLTIIHLLGKIFCIICVYIYLKSSTMYSNLYFCYCLQHRDATVV